jgi:hypothetical protein
MDELEPAVQTDDETAAKIIRPHPRVPSRKGSGADAEDKREPVSDIDIAVANSPKVLDLKRPIRDADIRIVGDSGSPGRK